MKTTVQRRLQLIEKFRSTLLAGGCLTNFQQLDATNFSDNGVQAAPRTYGATFGVHV